MESWWKNLIENTQANVGYSNEIFRQYLLQLSTGLVWKNRARAIALESKDPMQRYRTELFMVASQGLLEFDIIRSFPRVVLRNLGFSGDEIECYATNKNLIPEEMRDTAVAEYQTALTSKNPFTGNLAYKDRSDNSWTSVYTEENNYYRMLMGMPDLDDTDYVYNTDARWNTTTPVHELTIAERLGMEAAGIFDSLATKYPDKPYLKYLGDQF